jgi:hypothetical protein
MIRTSIVAVVLCLGALPASAQTIYGDEGGCRRAAGQPEGTDLVFLLYPDRVERWESSCRIVATERVDAENLVLTTQCNGEGETWEQRYVMQPLVSGDGFRVGPVEYEDIRFELRPC